MIHNNPAHPWTVASLASETGVSRAALARRFNELVGEPPMQFLTEWRLALAADLLLEPDATVGSVAHAVGYGSPFALVVGVQAGAGDQPAGASRRAPRRTGRRPIERLTRRAGQLTAAARSA